MKKRYGVFKKGFSFPMFVFDMEKKARECWLNQCAWSNNFYYKQI